MPLYNHHPVIRLGGLNFTSCCNKNIRGKTLFGVRGYFFKIKNRLFGQRFFCCCCCCCFPFFFFFFFFFKPLCEGLTFNQSHQGSNSATYKIPTQKQVIYKWFSIRFPTGFLIYIKSRYSCLIFVWR